MNEPNLADSGPFPEDGKGCLSLDQAADFFGVCRRTIQREIARKRLHATKVGARTVIPPTELRRYLAAQPAALPAHV